MMARPTKSNRASYKSQEAEIIKKLHRTLVTILAVFLVGFIVLQFFGPAFGSVFLLFSKNRDDKGIGDIVPPPIPQFTQPPEATNKDILTLEGVTEPGATVRLFLNGPEKGVTTADNDGRFTFADLALLKGNNLIYAKATDSAGNESDKSRTLTIVFDNEKPEIEITEPKDGDNVKNLNRRVLVKGKSNEQVEVKINGNIAIVNPDNTFELLLGVDEGDVEIIVEALDKAGNKTEEKITITYSRSS